MSDYVIWTQGLRGPAMAVLHGSPILCADDRKRLLCGPAKIAPEHEACSFFALARLYPPPDPPEDSPAPPDAPSPAPKSPPSAPSAPATAAAVHEAA
jgi:hypothetical protein